MIEVTSKEKLILDLFKVRAIKFGEFQLKSGVISPFYMDLRLLVSYPYMLELTAEVLWEEMRTLAFDVLVGVPYTGIPLATAVALSHNQTMIFIRKEKKGYGTKQLIEGEYHKGQKAVIIDDVISNGDSKLEVIKKLSEAGVSVSDIVILLDRGTGGPMLLKKHGYHCHCIYDMPSVLKILVKYKRIEEKTSRECMKFIHKTYKELVENK